MVRRTKKEVEKPCTCSHMQKDHESWLDPDEACPCMVGRKYVYTFELINGKNEQIGCKCPDWEPMGNLEFCEWLEEHKNED
jgi:hypothetical protein